MPDGLFLQKRSALHGAKNASETISGGTDRFFARAAAQAKTDIANHVLGSGSESTVYMLRHPERDGQERRESSLVVKAFVERTTRLLSETVPPSKDETVRLATELERERAAMEEDFAVLSSVLGDAVPRTRFRVVSVPIGRAQVEEYREGWLNEGRPLPKELPVLLAVQRRIIWADDRIDIQGSLHLSRNTMFHLNPERKRDYCASYSSIVGAEAPVDANDTLEIRARIGRTYPEIAYALGQIDRRERAGDAGVREEFAQAIQALIRFVNVSDIPVDVMGDKNVVVQKDPLEGRWKLCCVDPLPMERERLSELREAVGLAAGSGAGVTERQKVRWSFILNSVLVLNAYAVCLRLPDRVDVPGLDTVPPERWLDLLRRRNGARY